MSDAEHLTLRSAHLHLEIVPQVGASIARFDWIDAQGRAMPLMRPSPSRPNDPRECSCYLLLPWSGRIAWRPADGGAPEAGVFNCAGLRLRVPATHPDFRYPIHGYGWQAAWEVREQSATHALLAHHHQGEGPYRYEAEARYQLSEADGEATLTASLMLRNRGERLPYGLGWHPYFPLDDDTWFQAPVTHTWACDADVLPLSATPQAIPSGSPCDFHALRRLPYPTPQLIDGAFAGWNGAARIAWRRRRMQLAVRSPTPYCVIYMPPGKDFFCCEPVDHPANAHNFPQQDGLTLLDTDAELRGSACFTAAPLDPATLA